jgi:hypothetical protein
MANENKWDIDLFSTEFPHDHRWDQDKNAKLLNIVFQGGTFGNFLKFFLDKFSKLSPDIEATPFTDTGTSHTLRRKHFSGLIQRYHLQFINDNVGETDLPVCMILPNTAPDFLYLKTAQWFRAGDHKNLPDHLWNKKILENKNSRSNDAVDNICSLYNISLDNEYIPKFIVRDWYKLEFLEDITTTYNSQWFKTFKDHPFFCKQKTHHFPLESFFKFDIFISNIKKLDSVFDIQLDFNRISEMQDIFMQGYNLDIYRQQTNLVTSIIDNLLSNENMLIPELDVSFEGFLYARIEKTYPFVIAPLTNHFFKDTDEIRSYVKNYPEHYKAMNPLMPTFNNIPNPFYLYKK